MHLPARAVSTNREANGCPRLPLPLVSARDWDSARAKRSLRSRSRRPYSRRPGNHRNALSQWQRTTHRAMSHLQSRSLEQLCGRWSRRPICSCRDARQSRAVSSRCSHIYLFEAAVGIAPLWCESICRVPQIVRGVVTRKPGAPAHHEGKGRSGHVAKYLERSCSTA